MSASVVPLRADECKRILAGEVDPMRAVWDVKAGEKDRRLMLAMASCTMGEAQLLARRAWCDLSSDVRARVKAGMRRFRGWAEALTDEE